SFRRSAVQSRWGGIYVEPTNAKESPSFVRSGIVRAKHSGETFPEDAAPMGLKIVLVVVSTRMSRLRRCQTRAGSPQFRRVGSGEHGAQSRKASGPSSLLLWLSIP